MKRIFYLLLIVLAFSCKKNDINSDKGPKLSLDSLKTLPTNIPNALYTDLTFVNENTGFAIAKNLIVKTTDGGITWTSVTPPVNTYLRKIQFTDIQTGYITGGDGSFGILLKTTDGGQSWTVIDLHTLESPNGMYFLNSSTGFVTGKGLFARTTDGGQTWTDLKSGSSWMFIDVNFKNSTEGIATGANGVYFKTNDGGTTWNKIQAPTNYYLYDIYFTGTKTLLKKASDSLIDVNHFNAPVKIAAGARDLIFLTPQKCIGIGSHYLQQGYYPYADLYITNNGWADFIQKTFSRAEVIGFGGIAKMTENKIMILGVGDTHAKVFLLKI